MAEAQTKAKPQPNGKAPKRAAARAVAELSGGDGSTTEEFHGVALKVPAQLPQTFMMDYAELQEMQILGRSEAIGMAAMLVKSVIGEEQWRSIRAALTGEMSTDGGAAVLGDLMSLILRSSESEPGEPPASEKP